MYILRCSNNTYYTGSTKNLERRLAQHQDGSGANYTKRFGPVELVYHETFSRIDHAFDREQQVKNWSKKKKEALMSGNLELLSKSAKKVFKKS
jgi:putative endonuclease